jgi:dihydrodipicolinate synthase/N-acetylneuraminate lyase
MTRSLPKVLEGIVPPMVTPLTGRDTLDIAGLERLIEHILGGGVNGLFLLGTTGEAPDLSYRLRYELLERACRQVKGRVPVLVGITDTSFVESVRIAAKAADAGADGLVLAPPYYFPAGQLELLEYIERLVPELPLPLFLYNMPSHTKVFFEPQTVLAASQIKNIVGLKDSSANMVYFHKLRFMFEKRDDFTLLVGPEELLAETVLLGGHGGVSGGANLYPRLFVDLYKAAKAGDLETCRKLHRKVIQISSTIYSVGRYSSSFVKGLKCALSIKGICDDYLTDPFHRFKAPEREQIKKYLAQVETDM